MKMPGGICSLRTAENSRPMDAGEFTRFASWRMKEMWLSKPRRICEEITRGEFAAEKRCGEFAGWFIRRRICDIRRRGELNLASTHVVPECLYRGSSGFESSL